MGAKQHHTAAPAAAPTPIKVADPPASAPTPVKAVADPPASAVDVDALHRAVADLQQANENLRQMIDRKNDAIASLEEGLAKQAKQISQLTVAGVLAEAAGTVKPMNEEAFANAVRDGVHYFVVLEAKELWDGVSFTRGQGIDDRQFPRLAVYVHHGLKIAPMAETEAA